jgi:NYN domain
MEVSVFWDNSNIWIVGQKVCHQREPGDEFAFRIHFAHLLDFALNGRRLEYAYVGGSIPPPHDALWKRFENLGASVETQERGAGSGGEIAVDEVIQLAMANRVLDAKPDAMVLLTGDGSGYSDGKGFLTQLERAHRHGWAVEVVSWDAGCNGLLRQFAQKNGVYRSLEPAYDQVTFINNKRWAK